MAPPRRRLSTYLQANERAAGSVSDPTRAQLDHLERECDARLVSVDVRHFLGGECDAATSAALVADAVAATRTADIFGFRAAESRDMIVDLASEAAARAASVDEIAQRITGNLARLARKVLEVPGLSVKRVYLTGGDMTVSFCNALGALAIELEEEIFPHVSYGVLRGGKFDGIKVTTKGDRKSVV